MKKFLLFISSLFVFLIATINILLIPNNTSWAYASSNKEEQSNVAGEPPELMLSEYCLRDDYILYAQNQDKHGYCWNFATSMAATTTLMKATNEYYDFSELWAGIGSYQFLSYYDKIGDGGTFNYFDTAIHQTGLMLESDLPYQDSYIISNENLSDYYNFYNQYSNDDISNCLQYDSATCYYSKSNVDKIKSHIYNHGSLYTSFYFKQGFITDGGAYYKVPNQKNTNSHHAVSIIGWDDNFEKQVYLPNETEPTTFKGAWIILNSYTETSGTDGINLIFYDDTNISGVYGYKYVQDTTKDLYFYDKIESGYAYPTNVIGKYYGDLVATSGTTKQKNIFYNDVDLEYSYTISNGASIKDISIYLGNINVTSLFNISINTETNRFYISRDNAQYGNYKILVTYGNDVKSDTYLNNFYVTHGIVGQELEYTFNKNLGFTNGRDFEYYSFNTSDKNYVIYTNQLSGEVSFITVPQSVYSEKHISIPNISFEITNGTSCTETYSLVGNDGYTLNYNFIFEYYDDPSLQTVNVFYDLNGGVNHSQNYHKEVASSTHDLMLYEPTREGYTFAGWYLDYGNGSQKLTEIDNLHYIDWNNIHHMGENPTLYALSHYKNYYKNTNTVFVYAHWEELEYYDIKINITGNGTVEPDQDILINSEDTVSYLFKPNKGYCLSNIKINGISVEKSELANIVKNGLKIENITQDITIDVTFSEGILLLLNIGENIKSAHLEITRNDTILKFYDGDVISNQYLQINSYYNKFAVVVEVFEDTDTQTYVLNNLSSYNIIAKDTFVKYINVTKNSAYKEVDIGGATPKTIKSLTLTYSVGSYIKNHYISDNMYATSGTTSGKATYNSGQIVYMFILLYPDTVSHEYAAPNGFEQVFGDWYRKAIYVDENKTYLGSFSAQRSVRSYLIGFLNWDFSTIGSEYFDYGTVPDFYEISDYNPTRPDDDKYSYVFVGWSPQLKMVDRPGNYLAVYKQIPKEYTINIIQPENGTISACSNTPINCEGSYTYIFTPNTGYVIKDVIINGTSIGKVDNYTFTNVCSNQSISVAFEKIKLSLNVICGENGTCDKDGITTLDYGANIDINISSNENYTIECIKVNGNNVTTTTTLSLTNIIENTRVEIFFKQIVFLITSECSENGSITNSSLVNLGDNKVFDISPNEGYKVKDVKIDGVSVGAINYYTFTNVNQNHSIVVEFEKKLFNIKINVNGSGNINSDKSLENIVYGENRILSLNAEKGWKVDKVYINDQLISLKDNKAILNTINQDIEISVIFKQLENTLLQDTIYAILILLLAVVQTIPLYRKRRLL